MIRHDIRGCAEHRNTIFTNICMGILEYASLDNRSIGPRQVQGRSDKISWMSISSWEHCSEDVLRNSADCGLLLGLALFISMEGIARAVKYFLD